MTNRQIAERIAERHQYEEIDGVLIDATTAQAIVATYKACNEEQAAKLDSLPIARVAAFAWKVVR